MYLQLLHPASKFSLKCCSTIILSNLAHINLVVFSEFARTYTSCAHTLHVIEHCFHFSYLRILKDLLHSVFQNVNRKYNIENFIDITTISVLHNLPNLCPFRAFFLILNFTITHKSGANLREIGDLCLNNPVLSSIYSAKLFSTISTTDDADSQLATVNGTQYHFRGRNYSTEIKSYQFADRLINIVLSFNFISNT